MIGASNSNHRLYADPKSVRNVEYEQPVASRTYLAYRKDPSKPQTTVSGNYNMPPEYLYQQPVQVTQTYVPPQGTATGTTRDFRFAPGIMVTPPTASQIENSSYGATPNQSGGRRPTNDSDYWKQRYYLLHDAYTQLQRQKEYPESNQLKQLKRELNQLRAQNNALRQQLQWGQRMQEYFLQSVQRNLTERIDACRDRTLQDCQSQFTHFRQQQQKKDWSANRRRY